MKTCIHCRQSKPPEAFRKSARMTGGRENGCKDCHNARRRARYIANPAPTLVTNGKWRRANQDKLNAYSREWRNRLDVNRRTAKRRMEIEGLADSYIKQLLSNDGAVRHADIPQQLVEAQRELLKIKRYLRENSI